MLILGISLPLSVGQKVRPSDCKEEETNQLFSVHLRAPGKLSISCHSCCG